VAPHPINIVEYSAAWPALYITEQAALKKVFEGTDVCIEHIGSTSVAGLGGKPIIDILAGVTALAEVESRIPELEALGYEYVPEFEAEIPQRRFFRKPQKGARTHHLHCVARDSGFFIEHIAFRDYLRSHPDAAAEYLSLKQELAERFRENRDAYNDGKAEFIRALLDRIMSGGAA
jgi:GrpB-like predicted nucleotidyltransferase (UPF0157 family)